VDLTREITFCHSKQKFNGVPIMASNMDTVGTFEMAIALAEVIRGPVLCRQHQA
jgi:GMP reductase